MGNKCLGSRTIQQTYQFNKNAFTFQQIIGEGSFGQVWKVFHHSSTHTYAIKVMNKLKIITKSSLHSILTERELLTKLQHPFLNNIIGSFQDQHNLYLVLEYVEGGDLRNYIKQKHLIAEQQISTNSITAEFIIMCVVQGLKYLHYKSILHRDIKPENIIIDANGYCRIGDLGIARHWKRENANQTSGTSGYIAPQVILKQNYSYTVDYYALGVMAYQLMIGKKPFALYAKSQAKQLVITHDVCINPRAVDFSTDSIDFVNKLIQRKPQNRLGYNGIHQLLQHPWIKLSEENQLLFQNKKLKSPLTPYFNQKVKILETQPDIDYTQANILIKTQQYKKILKAYDYNPFKNQYINLNEIKLQVNIPSTKKNNNYFYGSTQDQLSPS